MNSINTVGIVAEYNPFHNGHLYQVQKAKEISGAENVVAVISGSIVQRGDFAVYDKLVRAEMAVKNGVNLVIELPCVYSGQTAEIFASGAVEILNSLGVVDGISFGTEEADLEGITKTAEILLNEESAFKTGLNKYLNDGLGFPAARSMALKEVYNIDFTDTPNNILAVEYAKAVIKNGYALKMFPVLRKGSLHDNVGSASYIRNLLEKGEDIEKYVPKNVLEISEKETAVFLKSFSDVILYRLRTISAEELSEIADVAEGIENRIIKCASTSGDVFELVKKVGTKRYSNARIRRILINALVGITKADIKENASYIRVLGADQKGTELLRKIKEKSKLPIITKLADAPEIPQLQKEIDTAAVYALATKSAGDGQYKKSPKIFKNF